MRSRYCIPIYSKQGMWESTLLPRWLTPQSKWLRSLPLRTARLLAKLCLFSATCGSRSPKSLYPQILNPKALVKHINPKQGAEQSLVFRSVALFLFINSRAVSLESPMSGVQKGLIVPASLHIQLSNMPQDPCFK